MRSCWVFLFAGAPVAALGCASGGVAERLDAGRDRLSPPAVLAANARGQVQLGGYTVLDVRAAKTPQGPGYAFSVVRQDKRAPLWSVTGRGGLGIRRDRIAVAERVDLRPVNKDREARWTLELHSSASSRIVGALSSAHSYYTIDSIPEGRLPLGDEYGARTICFLRDGAVLAALDLEAAGAQLAIARDLDAEQESLLTAAAAAIALRRKLFLATGARPELAQQRGLGDFTCLTFTCDEGIGADGVTFSGQEQVSQTIHRGREN